MNYNLERSLDDVQKQPSQWRNVLLMLVHVLMLSVWVVPN
jgi:hypothetical protein